MPHTKEHKGRKKDGSIGSKPGTGGTGKKQDRKKLDKKEGLSKQRPMNPRKYGKNKVEAPAKMKTNQDGGSYTAKKPSAAAKELKRNQEGAAKMGYQQKFGAARMSPSKRGDQKASELMHGAGKYYDGAGMYMNGAPKYEGAGKHKPGHVALDNVNVDSSISDMRKVIDAQKNRVKRRDAEIGTMMEKDSLNMVMQGSKGAHDAKTIYGREFIAGDKVRKSTPTGMHYPSTVGEDGYKEFLKRKGNFMSQFDKDNPVPMSTDQIDPRDKPKYD